MKKSTLLSFFFLSCMFLSSIWALWSLHAPGLYTSHDGTIHVSRLVEFDRSLKDGQFPPRWGKDFSEGLGSPVMILNYQLPYFIATGVHQFGFSYIDSYKITIVLAYVLSGLAAYYAFTKIFGPTAGFTGAILYMWTPYHFLDIYVRSAFGEIVSFVFVPLVLLAIRKRSLVLGTLSFAGLFLSHPVGSALFSALFLGYAVILSFMRYSRSYIVAFFMMFLFAFGLASFNLFPALFETRYTEYSPSNSDPLKHFPTFKQLVRTRWGFGFSTTDTQDDMSFQIGVSHWTIAISAVLVTVVYITRRVLRLRNEDTDDEEDVLTAYMVGVFLLSVFFMLALSTPVWMKLHLDRIIDFPWRILMVPAFITPYLGAWLVSKMHAQSRLFFVIFLIALVMFANRNHVRINAILPLNEQYFLEHVGSGDSWGEYTSLFRHVHEGKQFDQRMEIVEGNGALSIDESTTTTIHATLHTNEKVKLRINAAYYPGWVVWFDNTPMYINHSACRATDPPFQLELTGLIECIVPPGVKAIRAEYTLTPPQRAGNMISLLSLGALLWIVYQSSYQHTTKKVISLG